MQHFQNLTQTRSKVIQGFVRERRQFYVKQIFWSMFLMEEDWQTLSSSTEVPSINEIQSDTQAQ